MSNGPYNLDDYADDEPAGGKTSRGRKPASQMPKSLPADSEAPPAQFAQFITEFARLDEDPVVSANRWGVEGSEPLELVLRSGRRVRWAEQNHLFGPRLQRPFVMVTGHRPRVLSQHDVQLAAWAIIQYATLRAQATEADEFRELWQSYADARPVEVVNRSDERTMRVTLERWRHLANSRGDEPPFVLVDRDTGERLVRRLDFTTHVRTIRREPISWSRLHGWAREAGWELDRIQYRATDAGARYVDAKVFVVPSEWGEDA